VIPNDGSVGNTTERTFHMLGADTTSPTPDSVSMIEAYAESRARPHSVDPNFVDVPFGGILGEATDKGDDNADIITNAQDHNHSPPYPVGDVSSSTSNALNFYPGGNQFGTAAITYVGLETVMTNRSTAASGGTLSTTYAPGFLANCGLLMITMAHGEVPPTTIRFKIGVSPGNYKGVAARSMAVVN
jgi:hypothetical protein